MSNTESFIEERRAKERLITHKGKTLSMSSWERKLGLPRSTLDNRLNKLGWSIEKALTTPYKGGKKSDK